MYDTRVIGAGPAGLTAAIYMRRANKKTLVLEAKVCGGQIVNTMDIENYPAEMHISGMELSDKLQNQAKELGAEIKYEKAIEIKKVGEIYEVTTDEGKHKAKTLIVATGADNRKLGLENEDELLGKGVSYCATCDGAFYKDKDVAVVGGGNTALEEALYLAKIARKVYSIHRGLAFSGDDMTLELLKKQKNVKMIMESNVTELITGEDGKLVEIKVVNNDGQEKLVKVAGVFIAIGYIPETQNFAKLIKLDRAGYVKAGEDCKTNEPGIFVAGDARTKEVRQLVTATSDGAIAATKAVKYLNS